MTYTCTIKKIALSSSITYAIIRGTDQVQNVHNDE